MKECAAGCAQSRILPAAYSSLLLHLLIKPALCDLPVALEIAKRNTWLLIIALDYLSPWRAFSLSESKAAGRCGKSRGGLCPPIDDVGHSPPLNGK